MADTSPQVTDESTELGSSGVVPQAGADPAIAQTSDADSAVRVPVAANGAPPATDEPAEPPKREERGNRLEEIAARRRTEAVAQQEASEAARGIHPAESSAPVVDAAPASATQPNADTIILKVNRKDVPVTRAQRDQLLEAARADYEGDINELDEAGKNRVARMKYAEIDFFNKIKAKNEAARTQQPAPQPTASQPAAQPAPAVQVPVSKIAAEKIARALETVQLGGSVPEAVALIMDAQQSMLTESLGAHDQETTQRSNSDRYDRAAAGEFSTVAQDAKYADLFSEANGPLVGAVEHSYANLTRMAIAEAISQSPPHIQAAWEQDGWTPQRIQALTNDQAKKLAKDMALEQYRIREPGLLMRAAAELTRQELQRRASPQAVSANGAPPPPNATTPSGAPAPTPKPTIVLDRQSRKEGLPQTERATIPKSSGSAATVAPDERERANAARAGLRKRTA